MSLVADYGSDSDENDSSDEKIQKITNEVTQNLNEQVLVTDLSANLAQNVKSNENIENKSEQPHDVVNQGINKLDFDNNLFSELPQKKSLPLIEDSEDQIEDFIPKSAPVKEKHKVKITIPSLSDFKNDDEPNEKKSKHSMKGSGLLSLLPPVKGSIKTAKSFVPNVVANKQKNLSKLHPKNISNNAQVRKLAATNRILLKKEKSSLVNNSESEDEDIELPDTFNDEVWLKVCGRPQPKAVIEEPKPTLTEPSVDIAPEPEKPYDGLDNEAFKELVGKTKRPLGNIKLIDINEEEILPDKDIWMTKSLTDPELAPKPTVEDPVDPTRRKKHHITYLAQQAKANEQELANAWAASKNSRLASRAKYGF